MALTAKYAGGNTQKAIFALTHTVGAASETCKVGGTVVEVRMIRTDLDGTNAYEITNKWSVSKSGTVSTVTLGLTAGVTTGYVVVEYFPE
jgi:hypothetical protein